MPFCVVATVGTVATSTIDPIGATAKTCRDKGLWLHVDLAYGAMFMLSQRRRGALL
jgi:aromatic-L-amino-acid/L-tryptophan decarboxylase